MADKADFHPPSAVRSPLGGFWSSRSPAERVVLRDIWLYCGMLFTIGAAIAAAASLFAGELLLPVFFGLIYVCMIGGLLIHLVTLDRWARARRRGEEPDLTRIFD